MSDSIQSFEQSDVSQPTQEASASDYLNELKGKVDGLEKERGELKGAVERSTKMVERISSAFKDEQPEDEDDDTRDQRLLDMFLDAALEDQKSGGKGMPLTTKLAMETVGLKKQLREMAAAMKDLSTKQQVSTSAEFKYDQDAFSKIDMQVQDAISSIYGDVDQHLFEAVSKDIGKEIQRLKTDKPQAWEQIRRNPEYLKRMSMHFVEKKIPPRAREMLNAEKEKNTPMTDKELRQAFKEADVIKDPRARAEVRAAIRAKMLESSFNRR
jgi:hypothetical protein